MWIRSQNKCFLINCRNIFLFKRVLTSKTCCFVIGTNDKADIDLGVYSTKEKALKVLDMIEEHLEKMYVGTSNYMGIPFQMPQDEEV